MPMVAPVGVDPSSAVCTFLPSFLFPCPVLHLHLPCLPTLFLFFPPLSFTRSFPLRLSGLVPSRLAGPRALSPSTLPPIHSFLIPHLTTEYHHYHLPLNYYSYHIHPHHSHPGFCCRYRIPSSLPHLPPAHFVFSSTNLTSPHHFYNLVNSIFDSS